MRNYVIRRLLLAVITLFLVSFVSFILLRLTSGDAIMAKVAAGGVVDPQRLAKMRADLGIDEPIPLQYLRWISGLARGDFGKSFSTSTPTIQEFGRALPVTLELGFIAMAFSILLGVPIGVWSAIKQDTLSDYLGRGIAVVGIAVPSFWLGILLIVYPSIWFKWEWPRGSPSLFDDPVMNAKAFVVPGIILGFATSASIMRFLRTTMLNTLREDYIRTARAKGLRERTVVVRHALRISLLPVTTLIGAQVGYLVGGSVIIEQLFGLSGVGQQTFIAVQQRDYPQLQTNLLILATTVVISNLVTDLLYRALDPRLTYA
jgi:peptide/nickel transport system permease protein